MNYKKTINGRIAINGREYYFETKQDQNYLWTHLFLKCDKWPTATWIEISEKENTEYYK